MSENNSFEYMFPLNWVTTIVLNVTMFFFLSQFFHPPAIIGFLFFILPSFTLSQPSTCRSNGQPLSLSHQHIPESFGGSCKVEHHCSGITSTLMRLES